MNAISDVPLLADIVRAVERLWPASSAETWDAVGLVLGRPQAPVAKVLFTVDVTAAVVEEAIQWGAQLIFAHHPLVLHGVTSMAATTARGKIIHTLLEHSCGLLVAHTNGDSVCPGVADALAEALGLQDLGFLESFERDGIRGGLGRVGTLERAMTLERFALRVAQALPRTMGGIRIAGDSQTQVSKVAVCGGAGGSLMAAVRKSAADVYVTADLKHHIALDAREETEHARPCLIDVSHFASEYLWLPEAQRNLQELLQGWGMNIAGRLSQVSTDPWDFMLPPSPPISVEGREGEHYG